MSVFLFRLRFRRDHRWAPRHMSAYLDGELVAWKRGRMERHVAECGQCRRLIRGLRLVLDGLHRLPPPPGSGAVQIASSVGARLRETGS